MRREDLVGLWSLRRIQSDSSRPRLVLRRLINDCYYCLPSHITSIRLNRGSVKIFISKSSTDPSRECTTIIITQSFWQKTFEERSSTHDHDRWRYHRAHAPKLPIVTIIPPTYPPPWRMTHIQSSAIHVLRRFCQMKLDYLELWYHKTPSRAPLIQRDTQRTTNSKV